jgi:soluble lytic murein transglycosylase-like protein
MRLLAAPHFAALFVTLFAALLAAPLLAFAGAQQRETLPEGVRVRLAAAVTDRPAPRLVFRVSAEGQRWLSVMSDRLERRIPDRKQRLELLRTIHFEALRAGLDPQLVLGIIEVESGFRKYAVSRAGARGFMQVMPFWTSEARRPKDNLFHLRTNLIYGCWILRHYLDQERGDYFRALGRYNGTLGKPDYPNLVLTVWKSRWKYDGPTA